MGIDPPTGPPPKPGGIAPWLYARLPIPGPMGACGGGAPNELGGTPPGGNGGGPPPFIPPPFNPPLPGPP